MDSSIQMSSHISRKAAVCSDQPLATKAGLEILQKGGNAADAAVATFAVVSLLEPYKCGIGGDIQCMFYRNSDKSVKQINGSGRTGKNTTLENIKKIGIHNPYERKYSQQGVWVSIPGAVAGMIDVANTFGSKKLSMKEILQPAINLAEEGAPLPYKTAQAWSGRSSIFMDSKNARDFLVDSKPPQTGDVITAPKLAQCYKDIASLGAEDFYCGPIANRIVREVQNTGGELTLEDFKEFYQNHPSQSSSEALAVEFHGYKIWEMKPNTFGVIALITLKVLEKYDLKDLGHNTADYIHVIIEALKLSVAESWDHLCDPDYGPGDIENLLSEETSNKIKEKIDLNRASKDQKLFKGTDTSYMAAVDEEGNGCSFIASISNYFGSGLVPDDCGFVLNDRLKCMSLDEKSPNVYGPNKLSMHTIIPSLVTDPKSNDLIAVLGLTGRWMQPQGQVQVLLNMIVFGMDPQTALNAPRFFVGKFDSYADFRNYLSGVYLEPGIDEKVMPALESKGHRCSIYRELVRLAFGNGHIIARPSLFKGKSNSQSTWWSGADPRTDGFPDGY